MTVLRSLALVLAVGFVLADSPAVGAEPAPAFVLIPYEDPTGTDPHAKQITETLAAALTAAGITVKSVAPMNPLDAVASAAQLCARNDAAGLFVVAGRYEQTMHITPTPFVSVSHFSTHVDIRLDQIGCDGSLRWSGSQSADTGRSGVGFRPANVGADVDAAFRGAINDAVKARSTATIAPDPAAPQPVASPATATDAAASAVSAIVLVPVEEPGIGDPHGPDMTNSLRAQLQQRKFTVTVAKPADHDTIPATAAALCAQNSAQAIVVPHVRLEQSGFSGRSHATFSVSLLDCRGLLIANAAHDADMGTIFMHNFTAEATGIFERATGPALDTIFQQTKSAAAS